MKEIGKCGCGDLQFNYPYGITVYGDEVFVADCYNHRIQKFSTHGCFLAKFGTKGTGKDQLCCPCRLAIGPDRMLYVSDSDNNPVVFSKSGIFHRDINLSPQVHHPWGLAISATGNLHVAGHPSSNFAMFTLSGKVVSK